MTELRHDAHDEQWCAHQDALAVGEDAPVPEASDDPALAQAWADELAFYEALATEAAGGHPDAALGDEDFALIDQALALEANGGAEAEPSSFVDDATLGDEEPANETSGGIAVLRWGSALVAVAAAVLLFVLLPGELDLRASTGSWVAQVDQRRVGLGDALPQAVWLVAEDEACGEIEQASVCATAGSVVRIHRKRGQSVAVELRRGSVSVRGAIDVRTPEGTLEGSDDSLYDVRLDDEVVEVTVHEGTLALVEDDAVRSVEGGSTLRLGDAPAPPPVVEPEAEPAVPEPPTPPAEVETETGPEVEPTTSEPSLEATVPSRPRRPVVAAEPPSEMLARARSLGGKGDKRGAARAYAALIDAHPGSGEAQAARVSLGQLRLRGGRNKAALALFRRYLERGGSLAEEALWGQIQALGALGRDAALHKAVDELTRRFPRSVYRGRAEEMTR